MCASHGLKSDTKHPYQKRVYPFWRNNQSQLFGYSAETVEYFEESRDIFEKSNKFIQWEKKTKTIQE